MLFLVACAQPDPPTVSGPPAPATVSDLGGAPPDEVIEDEFEIDFGVVEVGCAGTASFRLRNTTAEPRACVLSASSAEFSMAEEALGLPPHAAATQSITFSPVAEGAREAWLRIDCDAETDLLALRGEGAPRAIWTMSWTQVTQPTRVLRLATRFELEDFPVEGSLRVAVDGVEVGGWSYADIDNQIVFETPPPAGSLIEATYEISGC